jgi:DNA-binding CsgD family transcriptional regulator
MLARPEEVLIETLTPRERQVLRLIASGRSTKELARDLGIAFKTAACHRQRVLDKCGVVNTAELVLHAVQEGLLGGLSPAAAQPATETRPDPGWGELDTDRIQRSSEESHKYRLLLVEELARSKDMREQCKAARREFHAVRVKLQRSCQRLLETVRNPILH